jgi:hypothetical protein
VGNFEGARLKSLDNLNHAYYFPKLKMSGNVVFRGDKRVEQCNAVRAFFKKKFLAFWVRYCLYDL